MRMVISADYGAQPTLQEVPEPKPEPGEIKVRVLASSVNGFDALVASGALKGMFEHQFPISLGQDFAGLVAEVSADVSGFAPGDAVYGVVSKPLPTEGGGFGEYVTVPAEVGVAHVPAGLDIATAGVLGLAGAAAITITEAAGLTSGETVLISGATGGVGVFAVQLAAARGVVVIATGGPDAEARLRELGVTHVVDYRGDVATRIRDLAPAGLDAVLHMAGDGVSLAALVRDGGRIVSLNHLDPAQFADGRITAMPVMANPSREVLDRLAADVNACRLRVPVARRYRLSEVGQALADFADTKLGKLAVTVG